jgi:NAD(P)-dependent dehydrogenase (short-subunit alcohol dehydrogenase family)
VTTFDFSEKVALVTGAGSGIGEACARVLARGGAKVVVSDVDEAKGRAVAESLEDGHFVHTDVANASEVERLVQETVKRYGTLHIAVNNAGIGGETKPVGEYTLEAWHKVIDINLNGVFYGMRYQIPAMLESGGGCIVNMASILGSVGFAQSGAYVAAKHAVVGLTRTAAVECSSQGIRVNAVGPGFIKTPLLAGADADMEKMLVSLHPIGRLGTAEEVSSLVAFLCSDDASFITGSYHTVDGGYTAR